MKGLTSVQSGVPHASIQSANGNSSVIISGTKTRKRIRMSRFVQIEHSVHFATMRIVAKRRFQFNLCEDGTPERQQIPECHLHTVEVAGSIPASPILDRKTFSGHSVGIQITRGCSYFQGELSDAETSKK